MDAPDTDLADDTPLSAQAALTSLGSTAALGTDAAPVALPERTPTPPPEVLFPRDTDNHPNGNPRWSDAKGPLRDNGVPWSYPQHVDLIPDPKDEQPFVSDDTPLARPVPLPYTAFQGQRAQVHEETPAEDPLIVVPPIPGQEPGTLRTAQLPMPLTPFYQTDGRDGFHQLPDPDTSLTTGVAEFVNNNPVTPCIPPARNTVEALRLDMDRQMNISIKAHSDRMETQLNASIAAMEAASAKQLREYLAASDSQPYDHNLIPLQTARADAAQELAHCKELEASNADSTTLTRRCMS